VKLHIATLGSRPVRLHSRACLLAVAFLHLACKCIWGTWACRATGRSRGRGHDHGRSADEVASATGACLGDDAAGTHRRLGSRKQQVPTDGQKLRYYPRSQLRKQMRF